MNPADGSLQPGAKRGIVDARKIDAVRPVLDDFSYSVLGPPGGERRITGRQRMRLRSGKLIRRDGQFLCECLVHNRSASGARLRLGIACELPAALYFYEDESGSLFEAAVRWRREREIGVRLGLCTPTAVHSAIAGRMRRKFYTLKR